jgi:hypothetical protein
MCYVFDIFAGAFQNAIILADGIVRQDVDNFELTRFLVRLNSTTWIGKYWI